MASNKLRAAQVVYGAVRLRSAWRRLEQAGLRPILIKGWSTARLYPDPGARPWGDIDLCFSTQELPRAIALRGAYADEFASADFHEGMPDLPDRTWEEIFARTRIEPLEGEPIRVLSWEEHLRLTCRHLVRHGACTPTMLRDVAVILDALPENFDWSRCLAGDPHETRWVLAVIALAQRMYHVELRDERVRRQAAELPAWLGAALPRIWQAGRERYSLGYYLRHRRAGWNALRYRYLNPVRASFRIGALPASRAGLLWATLRYFLFRRGPTLITHPWQRWINGGRRAYHEVHRQAGY